MDIYPFISVITIVKNDCERIPRTLKSVRLQSTKDLEYIVIDGGSSVKTLELIREGEELGFVSHAVSEPDAGIFDAMNKGAQLAKGEWVIFMNAGDEFYSTDTLSNLSNELKRLSGCDCLIGAVEHVYQSGFTKVRLPKSLDLRWGMRFSHQATVIKAKFQRENPFSLEDGIAADYGFFLKAVKNGAKIGFSGQVFSRFYLDGVSSINYAQNVSRESKLYIKYMGRPSRIFSYRWLYCRVAGIMKSILPVKITNWIQGLK